MNRLLPPLALALALPTGTGKAAAAANRSLSPVHQPVVTVAPDGDVSIALPGCPDWRRAASAMSTAAGFGCGINGNIAAMVADPRDLVRPRTAGDADPYAAAKAVRSWRDTPSTGRAGLEKVSTRDGK